MTDEKAPFHCADIARVESQGNECRNRRLCYVMNDSSLFWERGVRALRAGHPTQLYVLLIPPSVSSVSSTYPYFSLLNNAYRPVHARHRCSFPHLSH